MPDRIDFKRIATEIDVTEVANLLGVKLNKNHRGACPACAATSDPNLELIIDSNTFRCFSGTPRPGNRMLTGDVIAFYAHARGYNGMYKAALELQERFLNDQSAPAPEPQKKTTERRPERVSQPSPKKKTQEFSPEKFAAKLEYTPEVEALGLTEDDAKMLKVGVHRGKIYLPMCPPGTMPIAWAEVHDGQVKLPSKWLVPENVVLLKRPA